MLLGKGSDRKIPWGQLFIEAALVVFSVLLALSVKSCSDAQAQEKLANQALRNFKSEITENKAEIENVVAYHKSLFDTLSSENPPTGITLRSPTIQNNAWEAAQSTGAISYVDFAIVEIASKIEESQTEFKNFLVTTDQIFLDYNFQSNLDSSRVSHGLRSIVAGVLNNEYRLLKLYKIALKRIEAGVFL